MRRDLDNVRNPSDVIEVAVGNKEGTNFIFVFFQIFCVWQNVIDSRSAFFFVVQRGIGFVPVPGIGAGYNALLGMLADAER